MNFTWEPASGNTIRLANEACRPNNSGLRRPAEQRMDTFEIQCPVCLSRDGYNCTSEPFPNDARLFNCDVCGQFAVTGSALDDSLNLRIPDITVMKRAALSHRIRIYTEQDSRPSLWTSDSIREFLARENLLPSPVQQSSNIIRFIGDMLSKTGEEIQIFSSSFHAIVGSPNRLFCMALVIELKSRGLISAYSIDTNGTPHIQNISLTLSGWELYEREKIGLVSGNYGFIALKFNDTVLDPLVRDHIKPAIAELGYDLYDMRDVARAGVIDNLLRVQIRDSAFVLVDLTHENAGAYWEAGYAEGLGKPVLYICERTKFDEKKTHFDTNHCTTVLWDNDSPNEFLTSLIATLQRSLEI